MCGLEHFISVPVGELGAMCGLLSLPKQFARITGKLHAGTYNSNSRSRNVLGMLPFDTRDATQAALGPHDRGADKRASVDQQAELAGVHSRNRRLRAT